MAISDDDIINIAERAAIEGTAHYEEISQTDHRLMPEYWITCRVAADLSRQGLLVECEKRIYELGESEPAGRVDLAVYDAATEQNTTRLLRGLIEIKGSNTTWPSFPADFVRLTMIAKSRGGTLIGLIYGTCCMSNSKLNDEEKKFKGYFGAPLSIGRMAPSTKFSQRQHSSAHNDVWEIMSVFDHV